MSKSRADVINDVLRELLILGNGETADPDDVALVDAKVDGVVADLAKRDIYAVADAGLLGPSGGEIEDECAPYLAVVLAQWCAPSFLKPRNWGELKMAEGLLEVLAKKGTTEKLKTDPMLRAGARRRGYIGF